MLLVVAFVIEFRGYQKWTIKSSISLHQAVIVLIYHTKIDTKSVLYLILPAIVDLTIIEIPRLTPTSPLHTRYIATVHAMESLRWWRCFLLPCLMPVLALVLLGGAITTEVTGFGYLESLTPSLPSSVTAKKESAILLSTKTTTTNYLDSLHHNPAEGVAVAAATRTTSSPTTTDAIIASTDLWAAETTIAETPDDHYAKAHPGAGWAGYKHPMYGGYLNNLASSSSSSSTTENNSSSSSSSNNSSSSSNNTNDGTAPAAATTPDAPSTSTTTSALCVLEVGKKADYGDDIRWGAQVYLDNLK